MDLPKIRLLSRSNMLDFADVLNTNFVCTHSSLSQYGVSVNVSGGSAHYKLKLAISAALQNMQYPTYIAMCSPQMLEMHLGEPTFTLRNGSVVDIYSFLNINTSVVEDQHVLLRENYSSLADAIVQYTKLCKAVTELAVPTAVFISDMVINLGRNSQSQGTRLGYVANIYKSLDITRNEELAVYFDWLEEYGVDIHENQ